MVTNLLSPTLAENNPPPTALTTLGNSTKSYSPSQNIDYANIFKHKLDLQSHARQLLPNHRLRICLRHKIPTKETVNISLKSDKASYQNLMTCESIWVCPICSARIMAERGDELTHALESAKILGLTSYLFTFTLSHKFHNRLSDLLGLLSKAYTKFFSGKQGMKIRSVLGYVGTIRALETRYSFISGHSPHYHVIVLTDSPMSLAWDESQTTIDYLKARWVSICQSLGVYADSDYGLDIRQSYKPLISYLTKASSLDLEITGGNRKESRYSYSPIELLDLSFNGDSDAESAWVEYANAIKNQRMLVYSDGLKDLLLGDYDADADADAESTDADADAESRLYATIPSDLWHAIKTHKKDLRSKLLRIAERDSVYHLALFLHNELGVAWESAIRIYPPIRIDGIALGLTIPTRNKIREYDLRF